MGIGTSMGAYYDDAFHHSTAQWDPKYDDNEFVVEGDQNDVDSRNVHPKPISYDTQLTPEEQTDYSKKYSPEDSTDYDMQGYYKANPNVDPHTDGTHYPDTFKKPNHPTFSDESIYNNVDGNQGGTWGTTSDGADTFTPGPTNVQTHGLNGLIDYFQRTEPNAQLLIPKK